MIVDLKVIGEFKAIHVAEDNDKGIRHRKVFHPHQDVSSEDNSINLYKLLSKINLFPKLLFKV